jgi:peptidoglycan hydrolase CwlO-like protein
LKAQDLYKEARFEATGLNEEIKSLEAQADAWDKANPFDENIVKKTAVWKRLDAQVKAQEARLNALNEKYPETAPATME